MKTQVKTLLFNIKYDGCADPGMSKPGGRGAVLVEFLRLVFVFMPLHIYPTVFFKSENSE